MQFDKLSLIRSSGRNRGWFVISAAIHIAAIGALLLLFQPTRPTRTVSYIDLGPPTTSVPAYRGPGGGGAAVQSSAKPAPPVSTPAPTVVPGQPVGAPAPPETVAQADDEDTLSIGTHRQLGPKYGDGRLWVRASDAERGDVPARGGVDSIPTHVALVDSLLAERIRAYMDTVPPDSFATRAAPKWTTEIAGKTWGIDGKWIYLGGIKIPTAILAMLPLPANVAGNYDMSQRAAQLALMREDIMQAAQRASNAVEFKKYVKEVRDRKQMEHNARIPPAKLIPSSDSTKVKKGTPIPLVP